MKKGSKTVFSEKTSGVTAMEVEIEDRKRTPLRTQGRSFSLWIIGLLVSLAPLFVVHFGDFVSEKTNLFVDLFGDVEIFFICVSMLVSASCEAASQRKHIDILNGILLLCIILFALLYSEFREAALTDDTETTISIVTLVSLGITIVLGGITYFSKRR